MGVRGFEATADGSDFDEVWTEDVAKAQGRITDVGLYPAQPASYVIFAVAATYYARNGSTGVIADTNAVLLTLTQAINDRLTAASGGVIYLKDLEEPGATLDDDVMVVEDYEGIRRVYSNQGQYMPFSVLAADPATGGWGAAELGYWWLNSTAGVFKYWDGAAVVTFAGGGAPAAHVLDTTGPHTGTLLLTDLEVGVRGEVIIRGAADWEALGVGAALQALLSGGAGANPYWGAPTPAAHVLATTGPHSSTLPLTDLAVAARGEVIHRGAADWAALAVGAAGQVLTSGGAGVDVSWVAPGAPGAHAPSHEDGGGDQIDAALDGRAIGFSEQGDVVYAPTATTLAALPHGNAGQVLTSGGHAANPSWGAGGGGGSGAQFIAASDPNSNKGRHKTVLMPDDDETTIREEFYIPSDFASLTTAVAIVIPLGTGNLDWEIVTHFAGNGEQFDVHADSTTGTTAVTNGEREQFDISAALTGIAADDLVGIEFKRDGDDAADTVGAGVHFVGFYILTSS